MKTFLPLLHFAWLLISMQLFITSSYPAHAGELTATQRAWLGKAERHDKHGWVYLHTEGGPRERGFQHGYLLAKEIAEALRVTREGWGHESGMEWNWLIAKSRRIINPKVDAENMAEIDAIAEGVRATGFQTSRDELVAYNAIIDLAGYWWPGEKKKHDYNSPNPPKEACSSFIAVGSATADGGVVLGHNTMSGFVDANYYVIADIVPTKGHRVLMQTQAGWGHSGTDFFITDAGLVGSETTIGGFHGFKEKAIPEFVRMRRATQDASTLEQWCEIMKVGNNGGYANNWLVADRNTGEIASLELGLKNVILQRTRDGFFVGSNFPADPKLAKEETDFDAKDLSRSENARHVRWLALMEQNRGKIDLPAAQRFLGDHYDSFTKQTDYNERTLCGHIETSPRGMGTWQPPYAPAGAVQNKVADAAGAEKMTMTALLGHACGRGFKASEHLAKHPHLARLLQRALLEELLAIVEQPLCGFLRMRFFLYAINKITSC
jgi:hypothetical protein